MFIGSVYELSNRKFRKKVFYRHSLKTSHENAHFQNNVPQLWDRFYQENLAEKIPNKVNEDLLAFYTDYEGDYSKPFTYLLGCEVSHLDNIPEEMKGLEIKASSYVVFTAKAGFPLSMMNIWQTIWDSNLKRAYTTDFEVYKPMFKLQGNPEIKIFIALEK